MSNMKDAYVREDPNFITTWSTSAGELRLVPMDNSAGYSVRPGIYELKGAHAIRGGVSFTIQSAGAKLRCIEQRNGCDAAFSRYQTVPCFFHSLSHRCDCAKPGNNNPA